MNHKSLRLTGFSVHNQSSKKKKIARHNPFGKILGPTSEVGSLSRGVTVPLLPALLFLRQQAVSLCGYLLSIFISYSEGPPYAHRPVLYNTSILSLLSLTLRKPDLGQNCKTEELSPTFQISQTFAANLGSSERGKREDQKH